MGKKKFLIIDSNSLIHRAFHALPPLTTRDGKIVNALYGFSSVFLKVLKEIKPDFIAAAFDYPALTFRHKEFKEYKAQRPKTPPELSQQIPEIKEFLASFDVPIFEKEGFEADDIIGTISKTLQKDKPDNDEIEIVILSGDLDLLQLVTEKARVYFLQKGVKETVSYNVEEVKKRFQGLLPRQLIDFKALRGDPSDNIPGVPGVGEKTAIKLIKEFGSLDNLYGAIAAGRKLAVSQGLLDKLKKYKNQAFLSRKLSKIYSQVPIVFKLEACCLKGYGKEKVARFLKKFEFSTLLKRLSNLESETKKQLVLGDNF
ncbi:hypothetical protein J7J81_01255 [bacterium]|nr:hypothetical protein [bacterium]